MVISKHVAHQINNSIRKLTHECKKITDARLKNKITGKKLRVSTNLSPATNEILQKLQQLTHNLDKSGAVNLIFICAVFESLQKNYLINFICTSSTEVLIFIIYTPPGNSAEGILMKRVPSAMMV